MVSGPGGGISGRLIPWALALLVVAACDSASEDPAPAISSSTTTTSIQTTPESTASSPTTSAHPIDLPLDVRAPEGEGPFPAIVLVHGGGWVGGSPELMADLARFLTSEGWLTVNTPYTLSNGVAGYPTAVDDVACAIRHAADHSDGDGTVAVLGHSAGAHLAALAALDQGIYGDGCLLTGPVVPNRLIGLAGPYDVSRLGPLIVPFFGVPPNENPALWQAGNPLNQAANNPGLSSLLMHGEEDALLDLSFATDFADALTAGGSEAVVEVVEGARHAEMQDPAVVGDLIVAWLERD